MGRRRLDRHRYGPRGQYLGHTSDDGPLAKLWHQALGLAVLIAVVVGVVRGCQ